MHGHGGHHGGHGGHRGHHGGHHGGHHRPPMGGGMRHRPYRGGCLFPVLGVFGILIAAFAFGF